ncbi:MAG: beta-lactamase family protein [Vicinamibacteria bacterium]|jgi:CubicO group peptidase (beta-lactamase class C family)|nr:beta-lactamase family protein [Vicinamibacteria bacterium]
MKQKILIVGVVVALAALAALHVAGWVMSSASVHSVPPPAQGDPVPGAPAAKVATAQRLLRALVTGENLPGASAAVAVGGRIVWAEAIGWADVERRVPLSPESWMRIGGITEALTAVAIGRLAERGELDLDAPIGRHLPALASGPAAAVTTRQLLAHVSGVRRHRGQDEGIRLWRCAEIARGLGAIAAEPLRFAPGSQWAYSAWDYVLAGAVAEAVAGVPFGELLRRELFAPLALTETDLDAERGRVVAYWPRMAADTHFGLEVADPVDYACFAGAGALASTPRDLVRFGAAVLAGEAARPETIALLHTPLAIQVPGAEDGVRGLGWSVGHAAGRRTVWRDGTAVGTTASLRLLPDDGVAVAVVANVTFAKGVPPLAVTLANLFREAPSSPPRPRP